MVFTHANIAQFAKSVTRSLKAEITAFEQSSIAEYDQLQKKNKDLTAEVQTLAKGLDAASTASLEASAWKQKYLTLQSELQTLQSKIQTLVGDTTS